MPSLPTRARPVQIRLSAVFHGYFFRLFSCTMRMSMRRFTRLSSGFSKKVEIHAHSVALHFMHYNFVKIHQTLRTTPAMAAGVTDRLWEIEDIVELIQNTEKGGLAK